eukprot:4650045-Prymnesium_polylepis.3
MGARHSRVPFDLIGRGIAADNRSLHGERVCLHVSDKEINAFRLPVTLPTLGLGMSDHDDVIALLDLLIARRLRCDDQAAQRRAVARARHGFVN